MPPNLAVVEKEAPTLPSRLATLFPLHFDKSEVIVVQLRGVKRWTIAGNQDEA